MIGVRKAIAVTCLFGGLVAGPAKAVTYLFFAQGSGRLSGFNNGPVYTDKGFTTLTFQFSIADPVGLSAYQGGTDHGLISLSATTTGLDFGFNGALGTAQELLSGNACFSNPSGLLPTSSIDLIGSCGSINYSLAGKLDVRFTGKVTSLQVLPDGRTGNIASFSAFPDILPEPSSWMLMLVGFGAIGWSARRHPVRTAASDNRKPSRARPQSAGSLCP